MGDDKVNKMLPGPLWTEVAVYKLVLCCGGQG